MASRKNVQNRSKTDPIHPQNGKNEELKGGSRMATERFYIAQPGEIYYDMLKVEAWLKRRTMSAEGTSILCSRLMQREEYRNRLVAELARKRGITFEQMWDDILCDRAVYMTPNEYKQLREQGVSEGIEEES